MGSKDSFITMANANNLYTNTEDEWSTILSWKVPRGYFSQFLEELPMNLYLATSIVKAHTGGGAEDIALDADAPVCDSAGLTDAMTLKAYEVSQADKTAAGIEAELTVNSISYANNTANITFAKAEDILIVYLPKAGEVEILANRPSAGNQNVPLFSSSLAALHRMNQDNATSLLTLDRAFPAPEKHTITMRLNAPFTIEWQEDYLLGHKVSHVKIPFRRLSKYAMPPKERAAFLERIDQQYISV